MAKAQPAKIQPINDSVAAAWLDDVDIGHLPAPLRPVVPVILSGGSGSRLWPLSRANHPKQFLNLSGDDTMLIDTLSRIKDEARYKAPIIICNHEHRFIIAEQARQAGVVPAAIVTEPLARNTAPAIAVAALLAEDLCPGASILVMPADHKIVEGDFFQRAIARAGQIADPNSVIVFGAAPQNPATGYGYIRRGDMCEDENGVYGVDAFFEKPTAEVAVSYIKSGDFYWNCGIFMFTARPLLRELDRYAPDLVAAARSALAGSSRDLDFLRLDAEAFAKCPSISIDYALMEKTKNAVVVPVNCGWTDVGSWAALWEATKQDEKGNAIIGDGMVFESDNCLIHSEGRLTALLGVSNLAVVVTQDAVLVADMNRTQDVKKIVEELHRRGRDESIRSSRVFRPWGHYDSVLSGGQFQVKRIVVHPGGKLSLQKHFHRAEHWIVVKGTALVTRDDKETILNENESTFLPVGCVHRLENPGKIPLELIEVQSGSYCGEDDIVRLDDIYGRAHDTKI